MSASILTRVRGTVVKVTKADLPANERGGYLYSIAVLPHEEEDTLKIWVTDIRCRELLGALPAYGQDVDLIVKATAKVGTNGARLSLSLVAPYEAEDADA